MITILIVLMLAGIAVMLIPLAAGENVSVPTAYALLRSGAVLTVISTLGLILSSAEGLR